MSATVEVKCVGCGEMKKVGPGDEMPMCGKCFCPMIAVRAEMKVGG